MSKSCQKLPKSCQKIDKNFVTPGKSPNGAIVEKVRWCKRKSKKLAKVVKKVVNKLSKSCQKVAKKVVTNFNSPGKNQKKSESSGE
jgi:DNA relaxase NicK